jgi:hypothetical protein
LSSNATRLFGVGALLQLIALLGGLALAGVSISEPWLPALFFVASGSALLGGSLDLLSHRFSQMAPHYPLYAGTFFLLMMGVFLTWAGLASHWGWLIVGQFLWLAAWLIVLRDLHWKRRWASARLASGAKALYRVLQGLGGIGGALAIALIGSATASLFWLGIAGLGLVAAGGGLLVWNRRV